MNLKIKRFLATIGKCAFVAAALLCSCDKDTPDNPSDKDEPDKPVIESDVLNIMSFNMRYPATEDTGDKAWDVRKQACVSLINSYKPDVIAAQELRTAQRTYLKEQLTDYAFIEIPNTGTAAGGNIVMLYRKERFTKLESGHFFLSYTPDQASKCFNVAGRAFGGDANAIAAFKRAGSILGKALAPVLGELMIDTLLFGGQISKSFELFEASLREELKGVASLRSITPARHISQAPFHGLISIL